MRCHAYLPLKLLRCLLYAGAPWPATPISSSSLPIRHRASFFRCLPFSFSALFVPVLRRGAQKRSKFFRSRGVEFCSTLVNGDDRKGLWTERFYRSLQRGSLGVLLSVLFILDCFIRRVPPPSSFFVSSFFFAFFFRALCLRETLVLARVHLVIFANGKEKRETPFSRRMSWRRCSPERCFIASCFEIYMRHEWRREKCCRQSRNQNGNFERSTIWFRRIVLPVDASGESNVWNKVHEIIPFWSRVATSFPSSTQLRRGLTFLKWIHRSSLFRSLFILSALPGTLPDEQFTAFRPTIPNYSRVTATFRIS